MCVFWVLFFCGFFFLVCSFVWFVLFCFVFVCLCVVVFLFLFFFVLFQLLLQTDTA